ncbi:hypothetical protein AB0P21_38760 [Kribbella sp. NPDC056861]|uniref:hypothetical protein n=1 Tax=Kribbella sp. NPDC056861 TaxID=3154857 RepID=UPI0034441AFA
MSHHIEINGHRVVELAQVTSRVFFGTSTICVGCGARFVDRLEIEERFCPAATVAHGHHLVGDDGLLYCRRCPLVAYDLTDVATEPSCPMPLQP